MVQDTHTSDAGPSTSSLVVREALPHPAGGTHTKPDCQQGKHDKQTSLVPLTTVGCCASQEDQYHCEHPRTEDE